MTSFKSTMQFDPSETVTIKGLGMLPSSVENRHLPISPPASVKDDAELGKGPSGVSCEDWSGKYSFAPIKVGAIVVSRRYCSRRYIYQEHHVARAMTKRYGDDLYRTAVSDVIIVGCGSAGLSCAYSIAKERPDLKVTILEAGVAPGGWV